MTDLTPSSLLKFIDENLGFSSHIEVKSTLKKAEKMEEFKQIKETDLFSMKNITQTSTHKDSSYTGIIIFYHKTDNNLLYLIEKIHRFYNIFDSKSYPLYFIFKVFLKKNIFLVEKNQFFSERFLNFISNDQPFTEHKAYIWNLCEFLDKNKDFSVIYQPSSPRDSIEKDKYLSAVSLISIKKFLFEIFNIPYEIKKERKSLLSDQTVVIGHHREENPNSLKNFPLQTFKYEHLNYNYDYIFSSMIFLFLIIQNYFTGMPLNLTNSEQKNLKKSVLEEKKLSNLTLLKKWIKKRPKDFYDDMLNYKICLSFLKFLKKNEKEERVQKYLVKIIKLLEEKKMNGLDYSLLELKTSSNIHMNDEMIKDYFRYSFNKIGFKELAKILNFIDLKLFVKMDFLKFDTTQFFKICDERILSLSKFFEFNFQSQKKNESKILVLANYFELARFLYQEKNYLSLYIIIITMISQNVEKFVKENLKNIEKYYINVVKDLSFYQKLYSDSFRVLKDKLNHHQNEKCPSIPLFKVYQKELYTIEKKYNMFEKKDFLISEKLIKKEKIFEQISCFKKYLVRQATIFFQGFQKNDNYYFLKFNYKSILSKGVK